MFHMQSTYLLKLTVRLTPQFVSVSPFNIRLGQTRSKIQHTITCFVLSLFIASLKTLEDDRCFHVALPVAAFHVVITSLSLREQPLLPALDMFSAGWVGIRPNQGAVAQMLPKMTQDPTYSN